MTCVSFHLLPSLLESCKLFDSTRVSIPPRKSWIFFLENSGTWKVLEKHFGSGKSWKLKLKVLESPGKISLKITHFILVLMEN